MRHFLEREETGPSRWIIIDPRPPGYIGQEIVDLSMGAIELRHSARELRMMAEQRENWIDVRELAGDWTRWPGDRPDHVHDLSFGVRVIYAVDYDPQAEFFTGKPIRHLAVQGAKQQPTLATVGEIASYFYGRRPAQMRIVPSGLAHVVVGMDWQHLDPAQLLRLL